MAFPNSEIYPQSITMRDAKGFTGTFRYFINGNPGTAMDVAVQVGVTRVAFAALSNAAVQSASGYNSLTGVVQYGAAATYLPIYTKAVMLFQDSAGGMHKYRVPSPKAALFLADQQTINPANTLVMAFVAAMITAGSGGVYNSTKSGLQIINFFGGILESAAPRRRYGFLQLTPGLTSEEPAE